MNDFMIVAYGVSELKESNFIILQEGQRVSQTINLDVAVIGAGTGLGAAHLVYKNNQYHALSSKEGHIGFAPENALQSKLLWLQQKHQHISLEMILSGKGLVTLYQFFNQKTSIKESEQVRHDIKTKDPSQVITEYAMSNTDELCQKTLSCFVDIYDAAAGNVALNYYPVSELYIAGGIAGKIKVGLYGALTKIKSIYKDQVCTIFELFIISSHGSNRVKFY